MERLYTLTQICRLTGLSRWSLGRWIRTGRGPVHHRTPGGVYLFRLSDVESWIASLPGTAAARERK